MARKINVTKLRTNLSQLKGEKKDTKKNKKSVFWSPDVGKHEVYVLPWTEDEDEDPIKTRWFYFTLGGGKDDRGFWIKAPLTLKQFGESDPVQDRAQKLWDSEDLADKEIAKKLFPNQTAYIPVIVKGEEELGVRLWRFSSKSVHARLISLFMDYEKYGNFIDPENSRWIELTVEHVPDKKKPLDKKLLPPDPAFDKCPLSEDPDQIKEWLENIPDLDEALKWQKKNASQLQEMLENWAVPKKENDDDKEEKNKDPVEHTPKKKTSKKKADKKEVVETKEEALAKLSEFMNDEDDDDSDE